MLQITLFNFEFLCLVDKQVLAIVVSCDSFPSTGLHFSSVSKSNYRHFTEQDHWQSSTLRKKATVKSSSSRNFSIRSLPVHSLAPCTSNCSFPRFSDSVRYHSTSMQPPCALCSTLLPLLEKCKAKFTCLTHTRLCSPFYSYRFVVGINRGYRPSKG